MSKDYSRRSLSSDKYKTDSWIYDGLFNGCTYQSGWFDPCPIDYNSKTDLNSLELEWNYDKYFINPPYSNPLPWVKKAIETHNQTGATIVMLLKHDTSTKWYKLFHEFGAKILLVNGRLKHGTDKTCAFPSILAILF